ncbi:MAG: VPLPA-CTERM sorting domain-containing protein [Phycisphaerales bacterium]|nr:VPLPA-CTERM sorting domain-containing protein [Phycisphaerales bacterium]
MTMIACVLAMAASAGATYADSVNMTYIGPTGGVGTSGGKAISNHWTINGVSSSNNTTAALYQFTVNSVSGGNPLALSQGDTVTAACIDITHGISPSSTNYNVEQVTTSTVINNGINGTNSMNANQIEALTYLFSKYLNTAIAAGEGAEFQVAVWDILYNGDGTSLGTNTSYSYDGTTVNTTTASNWATDAANFALANPGANIGMDLYAIIDANGITQSFGVVIPADKGGVAVPLPASASMGLVMLGSLGGFAGLRNIRRRSAKA